MEKVGNNLREKILIVDDIRLHRDRAAEILARRGYATVQAESGTRALDMVVTESPDLVILDAYMPDVDGLDVVQRLKADPFTHHIPVLVFTGDNSKAFEIQSLQGGADGFVRKTFDPEELVAQVEALLRRSYQFNPLTKLPAAPYLHRQINARLAQNLPTAILYADIDHFRPFNQLYGHLTGDQVLQQFARLMVETLPARGAFVAHLGGDDFIAVVPPEAAETFAQTLTERYLSLRDGFYGPDDINRKYILVEGRRGELKQIPLMTLSVALVTNERRVLINYIQVSDLLADVMRFLKAQGGGNWARDRRITIVVSLTDLSHSMSSDLEKYRSLYFSEAQTQLEAIHKSLDALADEPQDRSELNVAFRAAHTLKAMSATMGYGELTRASHALEDLLARMKNQNEPPTDLTLRLLSNAAEEINVRLRRAETGAVMDAVELNQEELLPILTAPLAASVPVKQQDLNLLLELIAELAASSNQLENAVLERYPERAALQKNAPHTDSAIRNQRELVNQVRRLTWQLNMSPIRPVFERYSRILTELARQQNKTVRVVTQGGDVELCHAMLEALNEPLLHLLRNAITHGIELPAERTWSGKESSGVVTLRAQRVGDRVLIQVSDDGRGMDAGAILQTALAQGIVTREQRGKMNAQDALRLILLPDFSMSRTVTSNAGRGIGMNVVQERLNAVGGSLDIRSELNKGTGFTLDVPQLVGLMEVELVRQGNKIFAIPTTQITHARVWLPAEIAKRQKENVVGLNEWRILDVGTFRPVTKGQLTAPSGVCLVELHEPNGVALYVDELLGKGLLNYPFAVRAASIPILDPASRLA